MNYDRLYDMPDPARMRTVADVWRDKGRISIDGFNLLMHMREPRLELGSPEAPDPKSGQGPTSDHPENSDHRAERHPVAPENARTTTKSTTWRFSWRRLVVLLGWPRCPDCGAPADLFEGRCMDCFRAAYIGRAFGMGGAE